MSEQTPDTESGVAEGQDPSMEDILASIRKIIAEDDEQGVVASESAVVESEANEIEVPRASPELNVPAEIDASESFEALDLDLIVDEPMAMDADIDALIGEMDATAPDSLSPPVMPQSTLANNAAESVLDLEIPMDETQTLAEVAMPDIPAEVDFAETDTLQLDETLILEDDLVESVEETVSDAPTSSFMDGALAALGIGGAAAVASKAKAEVESTEDSQEGDDLSLMLDNLLEDSEPIQEDAREPVEEHVIDPALDLIAESMDEDDLLAEIDLSQDSPVVISGADPDIDLVKTLMADLTEQPLHDDVANENVQTCNTDVDMSAPIMDEAVEISEGDIFDEILSGTIEEEAKLSEEVLTAEASQMISDIKAPESLSLKDIAAAAEAEAVAAEDGLSVDKADLNVAELSTAAIGAAALTSLAASSEQDDAAEDNDVTEIDVANIQAEKNLAEGQQDDVDQTLSSLDELLTEDQPTEHEDFTPETTIVEETTSESIIEETSTMARAKKTDAIIDEVTESATAGAFASLSTVVEEKAVVAERGDRIGDLVMEALQPMLKEWLDANLKGIVERAVTKEVKRISSGK